MALMLILPTGAAAKFPFELKDGFRAAFPSAKWNSSAKQWEVGSRSIKRLERWLEEVDSSGIEQELAARDAADLVQVEIDQLNADISRVRRDLEDTRDACEDAAARTQRAAELNTKLEIIRAEIVAAKADKVTAEAEADAVAAEVEDRIAHITTRAEIASLRHVMKKNWLPLARARPYFEEAQTRLSTIEDDLAEIGVECEAVSRAVRVNFNRKDRDLQKIEMRVEFLAAELDSDVE